MLNLRLSKILSIWINKKKTIIGEKSIPPKLVSLWKGFKRGWVILWQILRKGLLEVGATQLPIIEIKSENLKICEIKKNKLRIDQEIALTKSKSISLLELNK